METWFTPQIITKDGKSSIPKKWKKGYWMIGFFEVNGQKLFRFDISKKECKIITEKSFIKKIKEVYFNKN